MAVCRQDMLYKDYTSNPIPTCIFMPDTVQWAVVQESQGIQYWSATRYNAFAFCTRISLEINRSGDKRVYLQRWQMRCLQACAFMSKCVYTREQTRLHFVSNAFITGDKRVHRWRQTRSSLEPKRWRYSNALYLVADRYWKAWKCKPSAQLMTSFC